jgi:hypothetical protein
MPTIPKRPPKPAKDTRLDHWPYGEKGGRGVSRERIRQIETDALRKLKHMLQAKGLGKEDLI